MSEFAGESKSTGISNLTEKMKDIDRDIRRFEREKRFIESHIKQIDEDMNSTTWKDSFTNSYGIDKKDWKINLKEIARKKKAKTEKKKMKIVEDIRTLEEEKNRIYGKLQRSYNPILPTPPKIQQQINSIQKEREIIENNFKKFKEYKVNNQVNNNDPIIREITTKQTIIQDIEKGLYKNSTPGDTECEDKLKDKFDTMIKSDKRIKLNRVRSNTTKYKEAYNKYIHAIIITCLSLLFGNIIEILELTQLSLNLIKIYESGQYKRFNNEGLTIFHKQIHDVIIESRLSIGAAHRNPKASFYEAKIQPIIYEKNIIVNISQFLFDNCAQKFLETQNPILNSIITYFGVLSLKTKRGIEKSSRTSTTQVSAVDIWSIIENTALKLYDIDINIEKYKKGMIKFQALERGRRVRKAPSLPPRPPSPPQYLSSDDEDITWMLGLGPPPPAATAAPAPVAQGRPRKASDILKFWKKKKMKKGGTRKKRKFKKTRRKSNGYKKKTKRKKIRKKKQKKTRKK